MPQAYKVVKTANGPTVAHLVFPDGCTVVRPEADDSRLRVDRARTEFIEDMESTAWGPVDERTVYSIGEVTEAEQLDEDPEVVSGAGLHAFEKRQDAVKWMEQADI